MLFIKKNNCFLLHFQTGTKVKGGARDNSIEAYLNCFQVGEMTLLNYMYIETHTILDKNAKP
ncbi:hypothetical protein OIU76_019924 [Salix suchowensis]|nr:hypothetical protein OIU76_019924 [Salix suchowensis]KAJ6314941.1 hypothetical protein OIU78_018430 [Salix suchowensis]